MKQQLGHDRTLQLFSESQTGSTPFTLAAFEGRGRVYQVLPIKQFSNITSSPPPSSGGGRFGTVTQQWGLVKHGLKPLIYETELLYVHTSSTYSTHN